jgi:hypothetical protein
MGPLASSSGSGSRNFLNSAKIPACPSLAARWLAGRQRPGATESASAAAKYSTRAKVTTAIPLAPLWVRQCVETLRMTINFHWTASARAIFADFRHTFGLRFTLGLAVLALCVGFPTSQALPSSDIPPNSKSFPIRGGSQPFAITMGPDGNFWFTLSNSNEVARISPLGKFTYFRTPTLSNPAFITPGPRRQHLVRRRVDREDCIDHTKGLDTNCRDH